MRGGLRKAHPFQDEVVEVKWHMVPKEQRIDLQRGGLSLTKLSQGPTEAVAMRVVALLSGGKDSCYSVLQCQRYGHEVVAVAHIAPRPGVSEADSFMYQTVGSEAVDAVAEALELPLFRVHTFGNALQRDLAYVPQEGDEVEDLVALLRLVKDAIPRVEAVCSGAIFSDYQRVRVESACSRVGLISLAYLWRRQQRPLLAEMIQSGQHAILVKVATMGLGVEHLGQSLDRIQGHLEYLEETIGSHVCGEGGEYETLVLDSPIFRKRLVLDQLEVTTYPCFPTLFLFCYSSPN